MTAALQASYSYAGPLSKDRWILEFYESYLKQFLL